LPSTQTGSTARRPTATVPSTTDRATERKALKRKIEIIKKLRDHELYNRIEYYDPYPYQKRFHDTGETCHQRLLMAGNRIGKSYCGAAETAMHLTGKYPEWWQGKRYKQPIVAWVGGVSNETVRDIIQAELLGTPGDPQALGTGAIPRDTIIKTERKPGVPNAISVALVKHISGGTSYLYHLAYLMGPERWYGRSVDFVWLDEEPPREIYSQAVTRTLDKKGMVAMTFTPENGMTQTIASFMNRLQPGQSLTNAGWDDATEDIRTTQKGAPGHLNEAMMQQILSSYSPHEREMRRNGRPSIGSGLVFPVPEEKLMIEPYPIPGDWPRISGLDFGWDHKTALVTICINPETIGTDEEEIVVVDCYGASKTPPHVHAQAIKTRNTGPISWPHDGHRQSAMGDPGLADQYRNLGVNLLPTHFTNPPALGEKKGGNSIETGIQRMVTMMEQDRFKVFNTLTDWWEEWRQYHRKDNKIVPMNDDHMSSTRYAVMSTRFAQATDDPSWDRELHYPDLGIV
jgi:phage terminase large subunit-like protein